MDFFTYFAILVATTLIQRALAPKIRNPMPALEDFQVPTAEYGRSIPWLFGTRKIKDPNCIWYGDLDRHVKTRDGAKYYTYYMGLHLEICIGPVDAVYKIWYGDKVCWEGEQTASGLIQIEQPGLYGGRYKEGGIDGSFNLLFGEAGQGVNNYLEAQIGLPLSAFRDSFCIVGRKPALTANSTYIKPLMPLVKRIKKGWPDDTCWYPAKAEIPDMLPGEGLYDSVAARLVNNGGGLDYRWKLNSAFSAPNDTEEHAGAAAGSLPIKREDDLYLGHPGITGGASGVPGCTGDDTGVAFGLLSADARAAMTVPYFVDGTEPVTIGAWMVTDSISPIDFHVFGSNVDNQYGVYQGMWLYVDASGYLHLQFGDGLGAVSSNRISYISTTAPAAPTHTKTHFFAVTYDPALVDPKFRVFYAGVEVTMTYNGGSAAAVAWDSGGSTPRIGFGCGYSKSPDALVGTLDEPFLHLDILSDADIADLYAGGLCTQAAGGLDMNPAHIIYNVWVDTHQGMAEDTTSIDADAMEYAANLFWDERMGLSLYWARKSTIEDFIGEVCRHAGALQTINPRTGQLKIVALRNDYDVSSLDTLTEDDVIEVVEWQDAADGEAVNTITVRWVDRDGAKQPTTYTNRASVQQHGVIAETRDYPGIATEALARRVAKRDVRESSANLAKGKIKVSRHGWDKVPGDVFIFSHAPEGIEELVVRVLEIDAGTLTDGAITLTVVQDVFSLPLDVPEISEQGNEWVAPTTDPVEATTATIMEMPYWALLDVLGVAETGTLDDGAGYIAALAAKPTPLTTDIDLWARISPASYVEVRPEQACAPSATLVAALDRSADTAIDIDDLIQIEEVEAGWLVQIGTGALAELCRVTAIDADAATVSVDRAILDTTPQTHDAATPLFFLPPSASEWARDPTQYADSDTVDVKLQTGTASGEIDISTVTAISATMASRQVRPYPPGDVQINSEAHPTLLLGALTVTWSARDRVAQGTTIVTQDDATDYGPESGTTYNAYAYDDSDDTLLDSDTGISAATWSPVITTSCDLRIEIEAERDGYVSWQRQVRVFEYVENEPLLDTDGEYLQDTDGSTILEA
jgi:hypothetical protein